MANYYMGVKVGSTDNAGRYFDEMGNEITPTHDTTALKFGNPFNQEVQKNVPSAPTLFPSGQATGEAQESNKFESDYTDPTLSPGYKKPSGLLSPTLDATKESINKRKKALPQTYPAIEE